MKEINKSNAKNMSNKNALFTFLLCDLIVVSLFFLSDDISHNSTIFKILLSLNIVNIILGLFTFYKEYNGKKNDSNSNLMKFYNYYSFTTVFITVAYILFTIISENKMDYKIYIITIVSIFSLIFIGYKIYKLLQNKLGTKDSNSNNVLIFILAFIITIVATYALLVLGEKLVNLLF
ncbi:hypothetical protein GUI37_05065 [Helcococcus kunzii]|uniref:hypothetical protein n=1 Tax=Helcococcus kunzii TaxID=40091 RepID=UPI001BAF2EE4|nr:hypothetical protein [Helcococcus kunzii]QUY64917.1 hypothetical protein GUI37_05065 [Helcococcus kunzii]